MAHFESLIWEQVPGRVPRASSARSSGHDDDPVTEWTARPLGRLGRPLLAEIEAYLEFFTIARADSQLT